MRSIFLTFLILFSVPGSRAATVNAAAFDLGLGYGKAQIENPDQSKAIYKTLALNGRMLFPVVDEEDFATNLMLGLRYLDLENTANSGSQSEVANFIGPGAGLQIRAFKFFAGAEYHLMFARHYAVGTISRSSKYEMPTVNFYGGLTMPFQQLAVSFSYSQSTGSVPKSSSELSKDVPFSDQIYWLQLTYYTGVSPANFLGFLF